MSSFPAQYWIDRFGMTTHIEGGSFAEVYSSPLVLPQTALPGFPADRPSATHIYFLLEQGQFSAFHRIKSDELWHFYDGGPLVIYEIDITGQLTEHLLGRTAGYHPFTVIRAGSWFASAPAKDSDYSLVGCTVSPGFNFDDFELATKKNMLATFPQYEQLIDRLTRG